MASKVRGISIEINGNTSGLHKSLVDVEKQLSSTSSALKSVDKALKLDPNNIELAASKTRLLEKAVEESESKLEILKETAKKAYSTLGKEGGATAEQVATLEVEISKTEGQLKKYKAEMDGAGAETKKTGNETAKAGKQAKQSGDDFEKFGATVKKAAAVAAAAIVAVGAAAGAAVKSLADCTIQAGKFADEVNTLSAQTGISTEEIQKFKFAADLLDVSTETVTGSMSKLVKSMSSAKDGTGTAAETFAALGVSVTDSNGQLRDNEEVFWDTLEALGAMTNETERDAAAMSILGKSAQDLNPLIEAGKGKFDELGKAAEDMGYVMGDDTLGKFGEFDDQMQLLSKSAESAKNALGLVLLPILGSLASDGTEALGEFSKGIQEAGGDPAAMGEVVTNLINSLLTSLQENGPAILQMGVDVLNTLLSGLISALPDILGAAGEIVSNLTLALIQNLPLIVQSAIEIIGELATTLLAPENVEMLASAAIEIILSLVNGLSAAIPQLIPAAIEAIQIIMGALIEHSPELLSAGIQLILSLISGIIQSLPLILQQAPTILKAVLGAIASIPGEIQKAASGWGKDLIDNFIEGIKNNIEKLKNTVSNVAQTVKDFLGFSEPVKGPLSGPHGFHTYGPDLVESYASGIDKTQNVLKSSVNNMAATIQSGLQGPNYSGQLAGISGQLSGLASKESVTNVYIGGRKFDARVVQAVNNNNFISGGR
jgi:phage-related minor tail protein